jgi:CRISPR-associated Cas5-like protein
MTAIRKLRTTTVPREVLRSVRASPIFAFYGLVVLVVAGIIAVITFKPEWLGLEGFGHFGDPEHRVHDLTYGFIYTTAIIGILAQLRRPTKNVASMMMALIPWAGFALAALLSGEDFLIRSTERITVAYVVVIVALLHPAGRGFLRSFRVTRINWLMLALVGIASVPLLAFASTNIRLQETVPDLHGGLGHYGFMAAFAFTVIGVGALASLRPDGWRTTAWVAGLLPILLGLTSLVYRDESSSLAVGWALAAITWGAVFVAAAERTKHSYGQALLGLRVPAEQRHAHRDDLAAMTTAEERTPTGR